MQINCLKQMIIFRANHLNLRYTQFCEICVTVVFIDFDNFFYNQILSFENNHTF